jgi:hypothetical protein
MNQVTERKTYRDNRTFSMVNLTLLLLAVPLLLVVDGIMILLHATKRLNVLLFTKAQENPN